ncbi:MAG: hypothetical protein MJ211_07145 [Bacteroidales bacterium]|nr:hypothetical protein [Bacteroidales bacterium]
MSFIHNKWHHNGPEPIKDGTEKIVVNLCFGPLETIIYGIKDGKYFFEDTEIEGFEEYYFENISKEKFIQQLNYEISLCEKYNDIELKKKYIEIRDRLLNLIN